MKFPLIPSPAFPSSRQFCFSLFVLLFVCLAANAQPPSDKPSEEKSARPAADKGTNKWSGAKGKSAAPMQMPVTLADVTQKTLQKKLWFSGSIISRDRASLAAETPGRIITVAEVGDRYQAGEIIVRLDDILMQKTLNEYQANITSSRAQIQFLQKEVNRLRELAKDNNAAISKLEETQAALEMERGALAVSTARFEQTEEKIRRMQITAPFSGVISERYAEIGEWVKEGDSVVRLVNPNNLEIKTSVSAQVLPFITPGDQLAVVVNGQNHIATLRSIVPVGDSQSRQFELRLDITATIGKPQQLVRVAAPVSSANEGLIVPEDALIIRHHSISVFTVTAAMTARQVPVRLGITDETGSIEVQGDLQAGDQVVIRGGERLRDGIPVRAVETYKQQ